MSCASLKFLIVWLELRVISITKIELSALNLVSFVKVHFLHLIKVLIFSFFVMTSQSRVKDNFKRMEIWLQEPKR